MDVILRWWRALVLAGQRRLLALLIFPVRPALLELIDQRVQSLREEQEQREGPARRAMQAQLAERLRLARQGREGFRQTTQ
jgi:hypothetical protein